MRNTDRLLTQILILSLLGACLWVLTPFAAGLFWAAVMAFASWPLMRLLTRAMNGHESLAAAVLTLGWITLVALPLVWLGINLAAHVSQLADLAQRFQLKGLPPPPDWLADLPLVGPYAAQRWKAIEVQGAALFSNVQPYLGQLGNWLLARSATIGGSIMDLALSLVLVFFFYRDGPHLAIFIQSLLHRLIGLRAGYYSTLIADTIRRVINGVIGTAIAQALLAMIGFWIVGAPAAVALGVLTFGLSLIPMGPPLIWLPLTGWLAWRGEYGYAIFLGLWGTFVVSGVDNLLKPYLISRGGSLPLVVVLLGVFGGMFAFGFMGLFLGPTLLAVSYRLLMDWVSDGAAAER